jgi:hypothetical protein
MPGWLRFVSELCPLLSVRDQRRAPLEHVRDRGRLPCLPLSLDFNPVPQVWRLVAAFGLVCEMSYKSTIFSGL